MAWLALALVALIIALLMYQKKEGYAPPPGMANPLWYYQLTERGWPEIATSHYGPRVCTAVLVPTKTALPTRGAAPRL